MAAEAEVIRFLLLPLEKGLREYLNLKAGGRDEFQNLNDGLLLLEAFLKDEAKKSEKEEVRIEIERQIRELVYDVEDTIETYLTTTAAAKSKNVISRFVGKFSINLEKQVKSLNRRVKPIVADIKKEFGEMKTGNGSTSRLEEPRSEVRKDQPKKLDKVVDFEDEETIMGYLKTPKDKLDVISIIGMPGLGKSTLAWKIYHNKKIVEKFKFRIWIHVSQKFNSWDAFLNILRKFTPQDTSMPRDEGELISAVYACLENNKFLLVLDDIWSVEDWEEIEKLLPDANRNGKVLVTSRYKEVGVHASSSRVPHELSFLRPDRSWELLQLNVFGNLQDWPQELRRIGQSIANQCGGVPLTIVVIGGILKDQLATTRALEQEWLKVLEDVNKISLEEDKSKRISKAVEFSYHRLPNELRECFLYMGMFPENEEISASTLTQLWIAEGFIRREDRKNLEKSAQKILNDLINMNLLMVERKHLDQIKTCRVHDMIREFCISKAKEENLFRVIKESEGEIEPLVSDLPMFHRLCLHSDLCTFLSKKPKCPRVRSFLCFCKEVVHMKEKDARAIPQAFSLLRVFNCNSIKFDQFPKLSKLILLKHITLSIDHLDEIPEQISQLLNLQTLVVETKSRSITVKANIWKMIQLRHVKTKAAMFLDDKRWKVEADGNLQTLTRLSPESCKTHLSLRASHLKTLGVRGKLANLLSTISLQDFPSLEKLKLVNDLIDELASKNPLRDLPQPNHFPLNLKKMTLSKTYLHWKQHMPILAKISTLEVLKLKENAFTGIYWRAMGDGFQCLEFLHIQDIELVTWEASTAHFPRLRWLKLRQCRKLQEVPGELAAKLEKLEIEHVQKSTVDSAKRIEAAKRQTEQSQKSILGVPFALIIGPGCN